VTTPTQNDIEFYKQIKCTHVDYEVSAEETLQDSKNISSKTQLVS